MPKGKGIYKKSKNGMTGKQLKGQEKSLNQKGGPNKRRNELTVKQKVFIQEYLIDVNAKRAAIAAGYSKKSAGAIGNGNLNKPKIATVIQQELEKRGKRTEPKKKPGPKKGEGGRPKTKDVNANLDKTILETIEKMANIQCTQEEIAEFVGISVRQLKRSDNFRRLYKKGLESGKASLRRMQWKGAQGGNPTLQIWLGKNYLGQSDRLEASGPNKGPITLKVVYDD